MKKKILCIVLSFTLILTGFSVQAFALDVTGESDAVVTRTTVVSDLHENIDELFGNVVASSGSATLENVVLTTSLEQGTVHLQSSLVYEGIVEPLSVSGKVYGFDGGAMDGKYYLIDFDNAENIVFVQAKVDLTDVTPVLHLILQTIENHLLMEFNIVLNNSFVSAIAPISDDTNKQKTMELFRVENNVINSVKATVAVTAEGDDDVFTMTSKLTASEYERSVPMVTRDASSVEYSTWSWFFQSLKNNGYTYLDSYGIDKEVILNDGWTFKSNSGDVPYSVASYSVQNGPGERLIQIIRLNLTFHDSASTSIFQMEAADVMSLAYDEYTKKIDVLYYNFGPHLKDIKLAVQCPTNGTIVYNKETVKNHLEHKPNTLRLFAAFVPPMNTIVSVWDVLDAGKDADCNKDLYVRLFEKTYELQKKEDLYGRVVRAVAATSGNHRIKEEGHYMTVEGSLDGGYDGCAVWSYTYTADVI